MLPTAPALVFTLLAALALAPQEGAIVGAGSKGESASAPKGGARQDGAAPAQRGGRGEAPKAGGESGRKDAEDEDLAQKYFEIADYDANDFITFAEAAPALGLDRTGFAAFDTDRDGRISPAEFRARYLAITSRGGAFTPPIGKNGSRAPREKNESDLAERFDKDGDAKLNATELRTLLQESKSRLDPDVALAKFDRDGSHKLEKAEIEALATFLDPARRAAPVQKARSLAELFGQALPREERRGATQLAPRIPGPTSIFRRLDFDDDGKIALQDLTQLQRPIQLPVRLAAVVATLDTDLDGTISPAELRAALGRE